MSVRYAHETDAAGHFREAMSRLATTVHIVTARENRARFGVTVTAVCSLAADPLSLVLCLNRKSSALPPITATRRLCLNMLPEDSASLADRFAGGHGHKGDARFQEGLWQEDTDEPPLLIGAPAALQCELREAHPYGTHNVLFCAVRSIHLSGPSSALLYGGRSYGGFSMPAGDTGRPQ